MILDTVSKHYGRSPSEYMGISDPTLRLYFDEAVYFRARDREQEWREYHEKLEKAKRHLNG